MTPRARYWLGAERPRCDICSRPILATFVDGRTRSGQWAIMCPQCRMSEGRIELGKGLGQKYERQPDGRWLKTAG